MGYASSSEDRPPRIRTHGTRSTAPSVAFKRNLAVGQVMRAGVCSVRPPPSHSTRGMFPTGSWILFPSDRWWLLSKVLSPHTKHNSN